MRTVVNFLIMACGALLLPVNSFAGKMPACVGATLSANQQVLVINDLNLDDQDETHVRKVIGSTFHVLRQVNELKNPGLRMSGPDTYWLSGSVDPIWSVHFPSNEIACSYTLVTNDAEFLILIENLPAAAASHSALRIYRRREHPGQPRIDNGPDQGVLVKAISLDEIAPTSQPALGWTDHTPQWYSDGNWDFTADNRTLMFHGKTFGTVRIDLATGTVSK